MEKLRIKLNKDEASTLMFIFYKMYYLYKIEVLEDITNRYLLNEILCRLSNIQFKGGRLSITPAEAVSLFKLLSIINFDDYQDIYIVNILNNFYSKLHKYLGDLL